MESEIEQLKTLKSKGTCAIFVTKDSSRFNKWKVVFAQRYANITDGHGHGPTAGDQKVDLVIIWEGDVDDPVIKIREPQNNDQSAATSLLTIHIYKNNKKIMLHANPKQISNWIEKEFPCLLQLVEGEQYDNVKWDNKWFVDDDKEDFVEEEFINTEPNHCVSTPKISDEKRKEIR